jgi:hypothetical protein
MMYQVKMTHAVTEAGRLVALRGAARAEAEAHSGPKAIEAADHLMASFLDLCPGRGACVTVAGPGGHEFDLCQVESVASPPETLAWRAMLYADAMSRSLLGARKSKAA